MESIMDLIAGDGMASKMGVISVAVAGAAVAATALVMRTSRKRKAAEEEKKRKSQVKLGSALEELTQKERERRKRLEEEVLHPRSSPTLPLSLSASIEIQQECGCPLCPRTLFTHQHVQPSKDRLRQAGHFICAPLLFFSHLFSSRSVSRLTCPLSAPPLPHRPAAFAFCRWNVCCSWSRLAS